MAWFRVKGSGIYVRLGVAVLMFLRLEVWVPNMGPSAFLGTLKGTQGVYRRYIRIPGLRAHTNGPRYQSWSVYGLGMSRRFPLEAAISLPQTNTEPRMNTGT